MIQNAPFASQKAEVHLNKAIAVAKEIGGQILLGQVYLDLGILLGVKKRAEEARKCLSEAIKIFEICEAEKFLNQAKEAMESLKD